MARRKIYDDLKILYLGVRPTELRIISRKISTGRDNLEAYFEDRLIGTIKRRII
jgi:hypothetical protein